MTRHKFAIGQFVDYDPKAAAAWKPSGPYEVVRVQPADDGRAFAYRIKSKAEVFERSAKEYEIIAVD